MSDHRICVVFSAMFGTYLEKLDKHVPVWVVQSDANSVVADRLRDAGATNITTFQPDEFENVLLTVNEHHPRWRELEVFGFELSPSAVTALSQFGGGAFTPTHDGFVFERADAS